MAPEAKFKETEIGMIPEDWNLLTVEEAIESIIDYRGKTPKKTNSGIPLITAKIVKNGRILEPNEFISPKDYESWMRRGLPKPGDVVITTEAPMGEVAQLDERKVALAQRLITLRGKKGVLHNNFLRFVLQSPSVMNELKKRESGTTVTGIKQKELRKALLPIPPHDEQIRISEILVGLDDKIELNHQMNSTLEQIAQTLFKRWFIDFEFPDENGNPYRSSGGRMVDSELGEIPEGWGVGKLGDIAEEKRKNVKVENINPETPYFGLEHIPRKSISLSDWGNASEIKSNKLIFEKDDILFGKIRPYFHKVGVAPIDGVCSTDIIVISPEKSYYSFVLSIVSSEKFVEYATQTSEGTKMPRANWKTLIKYPVVIPDKSTCKRYNEIVSDFVDIIQKNIFECKTLSQIRDSLLPKLMSGKIRVENNVGAKG